MTSLFDIIVEEAAEGGESRSVRLGIRCTVRGWEIVCPVSESFEGTERLEGEVESLRKDLDEVLERARRALKGGGEEAVPDLSGVGSPEELWQRLSAVPTDSAFIERFNALDEDTRREVAEHVLTACNVFSARPALFSSRYDADTARLRE